MCRCFCHPVRGPGAESACRCRRYATRRLAPPAGSTPPAPRGSTAWRPPGAPIASRRTVTIPASAITEISYGQDVHRRVGTAVAVGVFTLGVGALVALSKSKKHFIGLTWANGDKKGGLAMQCDKSEYRGILAGIEGITGKKAVNSTTMTVKN